MSQETLEKIVDELSGLTVLQMSELKKLLEEKWDVKAAAGGMPMMMAPAAGDSAGEAAEEATDFIVFIEDVPADKKIAAIKAVREITGLGLKEAKEVAEGAPRNLSDDSQPKATAEESKKKLEEAGCKVTLKPA